MSKSTRNISNPKVDFYKIRHKKADYLKHFVQRTLNYSKLAAVGGTGFLAAAIIFTGISGVYAQPTATPPGGNVNANFNSLKIGSSALTTNNGGIASDNIRTTGITMFGTNMGAPINTNGLNLLGKISNVATGTNYNPVNISKGILFTDYTGTTGTGYRIEGDTLGILNFNNFSRLDLENASLTGTFTPTGTPTGGAANYLNLGRIATDTISPTTYDGDIHITSGTLSIGGFRFNDTSLKNNTVLNVLTPSVTAPFKIEDNLDVTGTITNSNNSVNGGKVVIADDLQVTGYLQDIGTSDTTTYNGFFKINDSAVIANSLFIGDGNSALNNNLQSLRDGTNVQITGDGLIQTSGDIRAREIGSYFRVRATNTLVTNYTTIGSRQSVQVSCPTTTYAVSCSGYLWDSSNLAEFMGAEKGLNTQSCTSYARRKAAGTMTTNFTHYAEVVCFDPASTTRTDSN